VKFKAIPSYAYLKLKIPRPIGVITMEAKTKRALDYKQNSIELATTIVATAELREMCLHLLPPQPAQPCLPHPVPSRRLRMPRPYKSTLRTLPRSSRLGRP
jgi:hypothetical protein